MVTLYVHPANYSWAVALATLTTNVYSGEPTDVLGRIKNKIRRFFGFPAKTVACFANNSWCGKFEVQEDRSLPTDKWRMSDGTVGTWGISLGKEAAHLLS